jgi:hypothetical protein
MSNDQYNLSDTPPHRIEFLSFQLTVLGTAVKALIASHPEPQVFREHFGRLMAEMQTNPEFLSAGLDRAALLRKLAADLFEG